MSDSATGPVTILDSGDQRRPRLGCTDEHRVRFVGAPSTPAQLPTDPDFVPGLGVLYVHVHPDGSGTASAHLWPGDLAGFGVRHAGTRFDSDIRDGRLVERFDFYAFPGWLRPEIDAMAAAAYARISDGHDGS